RPPPPTPAEPVTWTAAARPATARTRRARRHRLGTMSARRLSDALSRWMASDDEREADQLREDARTAGCQSLADVTDRALVRVRGTLQSVTLRPRTVMPALEAELFDGTGQVTLVWLGRRRIAGVSSGRQVVASGRIATVDGRRVIFNPRYELLPTRPEAPQ